MGSLMITSLRSNRPPYPVIREMASKARAFEDVIHLEIGDFKENFHRNLIESAILEAIEEGYMHYTGNQGLYELRSAISEYYKKRHDVTIEPENVVVIIGAMEGLFLSFLLATDHGDQILLPDPGYPNYTSIALMLGVNPVYYSPNQQFLPNVEELKAKIPGTKVIIINTPNNPTGIVYPKNVLREIADIAKEHNITVISDETYENITFEKKKHYTLLKFDDIRDNLIVVNSFSKSFALTGLRLGFMIVPEEIAEVASKLQESIIASPPAMLQKAAVVLLENYSTIIRKIKSKLNKEQKQKICDSKIKTDPKPPLYPSTRSILYLFRYFRI